MLCSPAFYAQEKEDNSDFKNYSSSVFNSKEKAFSIYPNPVKNHELFVKGENLNKVLKAEIYDLSGKLIKTVHMNTNSGKIDISELVRGTYLFTIALDDNTKITKKVIKQ